MTRSRPCLALVSLLLAGALAAPTAAAPRVVVIGFDGADAHVTERLMSEGRLPNLAALAKEGAYRPLLPTNPPQTPVSWSTFATGLNPGRTNIFDFIKKRGRDTIPTLCMVDDSGRRPFLAGERNGLLFGGTAALVGLVPLLFGLAIRRRRRALVVTGLVLGAAFAAGGWYVGARLVPSSVPAPINNRQGVTFWERATKAGMKARIIRVPATFPADRFDNLTMLSGLGVPDVRGLNGQPTVFTTAHGRKTGSFATQIVELPDAPGPVTVPVDGPRNLLFPPEKGLPPRLTVPATFEALGGGRVRVTAGDRTSELAPGEWSDWHVLEFDFNPLVRLKGMGRFYNQTTLPPAGDATMELVLSPIHFHPSTGPLVGWCNPGQHAEHVADEIGLFKTMGWAIDTWTVSDGLTWDEQSLEDAIFTAEGFEKLMKTEISDPDTDLYVQVFSFTDRIQHIFWRLTDPDHPMYDAELARKYQGVVEQSYERMDRLVGEARALAPKDAMFMVLSDHGFASFRRGVNINRWLVDHGYMVLRRDPCAGGAGGGRSLDDLFGDQGGVFSEVDWGRTRAYAMGLGNVYVNLAGREPKGIVRPGREYDELLDRLSAEMPELVDPANGQRPIHSVYRRDRMYSGYDPEVVPDLRVANNPGYRVSWDTVLGGVPCDEITDNLKAWGADHCSLEPSLVKGILFVNRPLKDEAPDMADIAPSILQALGLPVPGDLDGTSVF